MVPFPRSLAFLASALILLSGCASQSVRQTLDTYRVGATTFADFKKDAGLVQTQPPEFPMATDVRKPKWAPEYVHYDVPALYSSWKLFGESNEVRGNEEKMFSHYLCFDVGDASGPIRRLKFRMPDGALVESKPLN